MKHKLSIDEIAERESRILRGIGVGICLATPLLAIAASMTNYNLEDIAWKGSVIGMLVGGLVYSYGRFIKPQYGQGDNGQIDKR